MKLKAKFTLIVSIFVITILALTAFFAFSHYKKAIKETIAKQQFLMVSILADEIDSKLLTAQQALIAIAKTAPPDIMQHTEKAQAFLDSKPVLHTTFDSHVFLFTPSGKIFVDSPYTPGKRGFDFSFREYMIYTLKTKEPYISDPFESLMPNKHPVVTFTVPLFDRKGKITGILAASNDLMRDNFLGRISTVKIGKTGYLYLTAMDRTMIMHPDKKRILTKQAPGLDRLYDKSIEGFEGTDDTITSHRRKMVSSFKRMKVKNWILGANYPQAEAYLPIRQAEHYFLIATITGIIAVFFIISFLIKYLIGPLELFTRHVEDLPQKMGDDRFLNIKTKDEIGILAKAFNKMVTGIDKRSELERNEELLKQKIADHEQMGKTLQKNHEELKKVCSDLKSAQSQILHQEKMASIGQLAAGVAHEINNPTGFILSNLNSLVKYTNRYSEYISVLNAAVVELADSGEKDVDAILDMLEKKRKALKLDYVIEDTKQLIKETTEGAERIKRIVQDLKSFSHVDDTEYKSSNINEGLESTINIAWNELKYKATVKREYGDIPKVKCNLGQLNQVFINILVNAAQAIEKQGEITVRTWCDGEYVNVLIADTGSGIPKEKIDRIFEPFFTTKEVGKGTGLGLSIAYDIIKKHAGEIEVASEVDKGTTFTIKIPVQGD